MPTICRVRVSTTALVLASLLSACGFMSVPKKMDDTNEGVDEMNGKMDQTNEGLDETTAGLDTTNEKLDETNDGLDSANGKLDQANAGLDGVGTQVKKTADGLDALADKVSSTNDSLLHLLEEIRQTNAGIDRLDDRMGVTNAGVHSQILLLALSEMMKDDNTLVLFPPIAMMPPGQQFAAEATADESLQLTHAWLNEIEWANIDQEALRAAGQSEADVNRQVAQLQHAKEAKLAGLQVIHGFLPQPKVEALVQHVMDNGRYRRAALSGLMVRVSFISMCLLDGGLFNERLTGYGQMIEAIRHVAELDYLGRLPIASEIAFETTMTGKVSFAPKDLLGRLYGELERRFATDLDPSYQNSDPADPTQSRQAAELEALKRKVTENRRYWDEQP